MRSIATLGVLGLTAPLLVAVLVFVPVGCTQDGLVGGIFNLPPTVVLSADQVTGVAPMTVRFSSEGSSDDGVIVERRWDFGDGEGTSREISPSYTYTGTGTYIVQLTLVDDQGASASRTIEISVTERPVALFTVDRTFAESAPALFNFDASPSFDPDAQPGEVLQYRWDFGDGTIEFLPVVAHTYALPGAYRVRLTVTDAAGVTGSTERIVEVGIPLPSLGIRVPPVGIRHLVLTQNSPLWVAAEWDVEPLVPWKISAGVDLDHDQCDAQVVVFETEGNRLIERIVGAADRVRTAAFSHDGTVVAAGGDDGLVLIQDAVRGDVVRSLSHNGSGVRALAFTPDDMQLVVGYADGSLLLRDAHSDVIVRSYAGHAVGVNAVAVSPDGALVLSGDDDGIARLRTLGDAPLFTYMHPDVVTSVAFSPVDSERVLTGSGDRTARMWSALTGALIQEFSPVINDGMLIAGHAGSVNAVAFSPSGTIVATGSDDQRVKLWSAQTAAEVATFTGHEAGVLSLAFAPDGARLVSGAADGTALVWSVTARSLIEALAPCVSPVVAVQFTTDGERFLAGIAAANSIKLDTVPSQGADLTLRTPQALRLTNVPAAEGGIEYFVWVEVTTDRSEPVRSYRSDMTVRVIPPFTQAVAAETPVIPLRNDAADVVVPPTVFRKVLDLGPLEVGDRVHLALLTTPGYGEAFTLPELNPIVPLSGFSVMMLDADERMFVWYDSGRTLFTRVSQLIIGHNSPSYYLVIDTLGGTPTPSVRVRVERGFTTGTGARRQYVHLNFSGGIDLSVGGSAPFDLPAFAIPGKSAAEMLGIRLAIQNRVAALLAPYGFDVSTEPPPFTTDPRLTIYFDALGRLLASRPDDVNGDGFIDIGDLTMYGLPGYIDPRNLTLSGRAIVAVNEIVAAFPALTNAEIGLTIGNSVAHQIGLMVGLRQTNQPLADVDDVMTHTNTAARRQLVREPGLIFTVAPLAPLTGMSAIGNQDAPQLLTEMFGTN